MNYSYVKIKGDWYHLQALKHDAGSRNNTSHAINTLAAVARLSGGRINTISRIVCDGTPEGDGSANPGYLLPYVPADSVSKKIMKAVYRKLIKLGYRPGRETKAFKAATR